MALAMASVFSFLDNFLLFKLCMFTLVADVADVADVAEGSVDVDERAEVAAVLIFFSIHFFSLEDSAQKKSCWLWELKEFWKLL
jgi:hypothetical protein